MSPDVINLDMSVVVEFLDIFFIRICMVLLIEEQHVSQSSHLKIFQKFYGGQAYSTSYHHPPPPNMGTS